jgi:hypothetical protein
MEVIPDKLDERKKNPCFVYLRLYWPELESLLLQQQRVACSFAFLKQ